MKIIQGDDGKKYVEVDVENIYETKEAVLLSNGSIKEWFPKTVLEDWPEKGESGTAMILFSWAMNKGFI